MSFLVPAFPHHPVPNNPPPKQHPTMITSLIKKKLTQNLLVACNITLSLKHKIQDYSFVLL